MKREHSGAWGEKAAQSASNQGFFAFLQFVYRLNTKQCKEKKFTVEKVCKRVDCENIFREFNSICG